MTPLFCSITVLSDAVSSLLSIGGAELVNARRYVDLQGFATCRHQYASSNAIDVRIDYSTDGGASWDLLIPEYGMLGGNPTISAWQIIPADARAADVLIRAYGIGSGLLTTVNFVEFQFR